jgi:hypothetical protein
VPLKAMQECVAHTKSATKTYSGIACSGTFFVCLTFLQGSLVALFFGFLWHFVATVCHFICSMKFSGTTTQAHEYTLLLKITLQELQRQISKHLESSKYAKKYKYDKITISEEHLNDQK